MRTTLTIDDDVAHMLEAIRKKQRKSFKQVVNEVLRRGIVEMNTDKARSVRYATPELDTGRCRYPDLDNVAEVLAVAEREEYR